MRRIAIAFALVSTLLLAAAAPTMAITKNYRPDPDHKFVGLIAFYDGDWVFQHRCTGELLTPTVVLTAGHCTDDGTGGVNAHARIWVLQDVGSHYDPATQHDNVTGYPDSCTGTMGDGIADGWCAESDTMYNYGFNNFAGFPNIHDVGIVILSNPITSNDGEFAELAGAGTVDQLAASRGDSDVTMRVSGYGLSYSQDVPVQGPNAGGAPAAFAVSFRVRLQGDMMFQNIASANTDGYSLQAEGNGSGQSGTCNGDSGGPVFWPASSNQVVAVISWGWNNAGCRGVGYYYRTDRNAVLDWIQEVTGDQWDNITVN
jgi:secreted trypsin-like serine protease